MTTNLNVNPYNDDFDSSKNFAQILFKPSYAVQARELTQSQSILRNQIKNFGDSIYQQGSVVIPGNSYADLSAQNISIQSLYNSVTIDPTVFAGKRIVGATSGVKAMVRLVVPATTAEPIVLFLSYISGGIVGGIPNGKTVFDAGEEIYVESSSLTRATLVTSNAAGVGSLANVNKGVYYVNGTFVNVDVQTTVLSKFTTTPSAHVLLQIVEEIIDSTQDTSLLDPANNSDNYFAPGADRLKLSLVLTTLPLSATISSNYVEIMRYDNGVLLEHSQYPKYSQLEKSLARRTFDETGNFVVSGLAASIREEFKSNNNGGYSLTGSRDNFVTTVSSGKTYIDGFEVEKIAPTYISSPKGRTFDHIKSKDLSLRPSFGQYILVSHIVGAISVHSRETVTFYNSNLASDGTAIIVGTAKATAINYFIGDTVAGALYQLWVTDITMLSGHTINDVGGIRYTNGSAYVVGEYNLPINSGSFAVGDVLTLNGGTREAKVAYWDSVNGDVYAYKNVSSISTPNVGDNLVGPSATGIVTKKQIVVSIGQSSLLFTLPVDSTNSLKNTSGGYTSQVRVQKELMIVTDASGNGSITISDGVIEIIEVGTMMAVSPSGIVQNSLFALNSSGNTLSVSGAPASTSIRVYALVTKTNSSPKTKTLIQISETFPVSSSTYTLSKTDISSIVSIVDTVGNITTNFDLDNGQTDYAYNRGTLSLKSGKSGAVGSVTVTYMYYQHSINGDYFSVDSYSGVAGYLSNVPTYFSKSTGKTYLLKNNIDFRPSVGSDGTFAVADANLNDQVYNGALLTTVMSYFVPRIDLVVANKSGEVFTLYGNPDLKPLSPRVGTDQLALYSVFVPAYTESIADIKVKRLAIDRYTMGDINKLDNRIKRLEDYSTLTNVEAALTTTNLVDSNTGLSKFKTGFLVENFSNPSVIGDTYNANYTVYLNGKSITARREVLLCDTAMTSNSSNYINNNGKITASYTEVVFAQQPVSSRVTNLNPFSVIAWNGTLQITPPMDSWIEIHTLPDVLNTINTTVDVTQWVQGPNPATTPNPNASYVYGGDFTVCPSSPIAMYESSAANGAGDSAGTASGPSGDSASASSSGDASGDGGDGGGSAE